MVNTVFTALLGLALIVLALAGSVVLLAMLATLLLRNGVDIP